jgi:hypothetical protein
VRFLKCTEDCLRFGTGANQIARGDQFVSAWHEGLCVCGHVGAVNDSKDFILRFP